MTSKVQKDRAWLEFDAYCDGNLDWFNVRPRYEVSNSPCRLPRIKLMTSRLRLHEKLAIYVMGMCCSDMIEWACRGRQSSQRADEPSAEQPQQPEGVELVIVSRFRYTEPAIPICADQHDLDTLVLRALTITQSGHHDRDSFLALLELNNISDNDNGWIQVVWTVVKLIPLNNPFGASTIVIVIEECPLPSTKTVLQLMDILKLSRERAIANESLHIERNICVVLGCIAAKLVGTRILTSKTLEYLVTLLLQTDNAILALHSLLALENFAMNQENRINIQRALKLYEDKFLRLEQQITNYDWCWRQVGFCARWAMDNILMVEGRTMSHEVTNMSGINAILDYHDLSQCLKISSDGLEVRNDSPVFESIRCDYKVTRGCWYYECTLVTDGVMQIGWANEHSSFVGQDGFGIGDDLFSLSYDGCRNLYWYNAQSTPVPPNVPQWKAGDIVGTVIDIENGEIAFTLNGMLVVACGILFENVSASQYTMGYYAGASLMAFQQCRFNFGSGPFHYAPPGGRSVRNFNDSAILSDHKKVVMPRRVLLESMRTTEQLTDCCFLCCDDVAAFVVVKPCNHGGICGICVSKLKECPICRGPIEDVAMEE